MFRYIARRVIFSIPVLLVSSVLVFVVIRANGDFLRSLGNNPRADPAAILKAREKLGLNKSGVEQYTTWFTHFIRGDWGVSLLTNQPVAKDIRDALWNTFVLGSVATAFSLIVGVGIGVYSAIRQYSLFDHISTGAAFFGLSIPNFWFGLMLQIFFGIYLVKWLHLSNPIFYITGMLRPGTTGFSFTDRVRHIVLPALVLAVQIIAVYSRYMRASMLEVMGQDFVQMARAKGLPARVVIFKHVLRNSLIPQVTILASILPGLIGGSVIIETIFSIPGLGQLGYESVLARDYPTVMALFTVSALLTLLGILISDLLLALVDPRIAFGRRQQ